MKMNATEPVYGANVGEREIITHKPDRCEGEWCVIHNPSDHHMRDWPMLMRMDKLALVERTCPHGVGHPDPDSLAYFLRHGDDWMGVHGCDRCCVEGDDG